MPAKEKLKSHFVSQNNLHFLEIIKQTNRPHGTKHILTLSSDQRYHRHCNQHLKMENRKECDKDLS